MKVKFEGVPQNYGTNNYLTPGKLYDVKEILGVDFFAIDSDDGYKLVAATKGCAHIDGRNWIPVVDHNDPHPQLNQLSYKEVNETALEV